VTIEQLAAKSEEILDELERAIVGKREALELVLLGVLADGHVLIEDFPGLAKTLIARSFAQVTSMRFKRVQFTPDLMPGDVTGSSIFDQRTSDFEFRPGPIFTNLLLADEINRAPPKTQAALLEGMQEQQVTIEGTTHVLQRPFLVLATQNPVEYEGTYPLPEAQLDRFLFKAVVRYPEPAEETAILRAHDKGTPLAHVATLAPLDPGALRAAAAEIEAVTVEASMPTPWSGGSSRDWTSRGSPPPLARRDPDPPAAPARAPPRRRDPARRRRRVRRLPSDRRRSCARGPHPRDRRLASQSAPRR